jgi:hypothetical protein
MFHLERALLLDRFFHPAIPEKWVELNPCGLYKANKEAFGKELGSDSQSLPIDHE